jgi:hypothetical protein
MNQIIYEKRKLNKKKSLTRGRKIAKTKKNYAKNYTLIGGAMYIPQPIQPISAFATGVNPVVAYIYHIDKLDGYKTYFGMVRKCPPNGRIHYKYGTIVGSAGTKIQYHGKWTSIGGSRDTSISNLRAVITELNHETQSGHRFSSKNVDMSKIDRGVGKMPYNALGKTDSNTLICHMVRLQDSQQSPIIFLFEIPNRSTFFDVFPKDGYTSAELLRSSQGEIDAIKSFTLDEIITNQSNEIASYNNNYFISYFMKNFNNIILPTILDIQVHNQARQDWLSAFQRKIYILNNINVNADINPRNPSEFTHPPYAT